MDADTPLDSIRTKLFYGLLDYTKSFPDFSIAQHFKMVGANERGELIRNISDDLDGGNNLLIYIHLPFCSSECVFCNSYPQKTNTDIQDKYIGGILKEIDIYKSHRVFEGKTAKCLYFGGGTPTAFSNSDIRRVIQKLNTVINIPDTCSITCEAHTRDLLETQRIEELSALGINRISVGCQTFDQRVLKLCRRFHSASQVKEVIRDARHLGLSANLDMMTGLPGQTLDGVRRDLDILCDIAPDSIEYMRHEVVNPSAISLYRRNPELLVKPDELFWMTYQAQEWMELNGYEQNGNFTREHQFPYRYHWLQETPFVSLGSRSRSYTENICYDKHEDLSIYLRLIGQGTIPIARYMVLNKTERMYRSLFLRLQIRSGLELAEFESRFGESGLDVFAGVVDQLTEYGCIEADDSSIKLSRYGRYFVEDVCCFIIDQAVREGGYESHFTRMPHSSGAFAERLATRLKLRENG